MYTGLSFSLSYLVVVTVVVVALVLVVVIVRPALIIARVVYCLQPPPSSARVSVAAQLSKSIRQIPGHPTARAYAFIYMYLL